MLTARDNRVETSHKHWLAAAAVHSAVTRQGKREIKTETKRILKDAEKLYRVSLERFRSEHRAKFPYLDVFELEKWVHFSRRRFVSRQRELTYVDNDRALVFENVNCITRSWNITRNSPIHKREYLNTDQLSNTGTFKINIINTRVENFGTQYVRSCRTFNR